jgi:hypothetical protein
MYTNEIIFFFGWGWFWNSGILCTCKASSLLHDPHLQSILLWLFWRWNLETVCLGWPQTLILPISAFQEASMTGVSHWSLAYKYILSHENNEHAFEVLRIPSVMVPIAFRLCCLFYMYLRFHFNKKKN